MSRRPASCFSAPFIASVAVLALAGCRGDKPAPAEPFPAATSAASTPAETPTTTPAPAPAASTAPAPAAAAPETAPVAATTPPPSEAPPAPAPAADPNAKPADKEPDALQWLADSEARKANQERRVKEGEANLAIANAAVADWERTLLEFKNPFLARPKLSPEDAAAIAGMDGKARVQWAEGRLAAAKASRDDLQKSLDDMKANPPLN